jgi:hypothetical protein
VENKPINTNLLVSCNADVLNQIFHITQRAKCRHEPAIPLFSLTDVIRGSTFNEELGALKDVLYSWLATITALFQKI